MFRSKDNKNFEKIIDVIDNKILNRKIYDYLNSTEKFISDYFPEKQKEPIVK